MSIPITEVFLSDTENPQEKGGLIWKTIVRTGEWKVHPNGTGEPLKFVKENAGEGEVALADIKEAFDDGAMEFVTVPLSESIQRESHHDNPRDNTGFIKELQIVDGNDGISRLVAGHEFTDKEIEKKVIEGSIKGNSAGIINNYQRKSDGKVYPWVLAHSAITHRPWLDGMEPYGFAASDEISQINTLIEPNHEVSSESQVEAVVEPESTPSNEDEISGIKKYLENINQTFKDFAEAWKPPQKQSVKEEESAAPPAQPQDELTTNTPSFPVQKTEEDEVREARQKREALLSQERSRQSTNIGGNSMTDLTKLNLSDEQRTAFEAQQAQLQERETELAKLRAEARKSEVESRIAELKELGLEQHPGLLKVLKNIYMSDDGEVALLLSEEGNSSKSRVTASQIADSIVDALPKEGEKIALSAQAPTKEEADVKPPVDANEEIKLEDRVKATREFLNLPEPVKGVTK